MNALEIQGLCKVYAGTGKATVTALSDVDLVVASGDVFGFLGPNGAGKSTTIKIIMGLITATTGNALVYGMPVSEVKSRSKIGYLPENPSFYNFLTAQEYLSFVGTTFGMTKKQVGIEADRVLGLMDLRDSANRPIRGYSKGMVQRLGIAQALLHDPDLYILDEPMSGLDPLGRALVKDIITDLKKRGKTVFFSTHITSDVEVVCDKIGILVGGKVRAMENVGQLMRRGIEGYFVQLTHVHESSNVLNGIITLEVSPGVKEAYVPKEQFNDFIASVAATGAEISFVEPKRKNLESFLLEIVSKG